MTGWPGVSEPLEGARLRVLSLGAGVQSSTLALMAARGEVGPMPDCAIFADTGWEPKKVYDWLDQLERLLPFPVHRVVYSDLRADVMLANGGGKGSTRIPAFVADKGGGAGGLISRQCTRDYKVVPIRKKVRELLGLTGKRAGKTPIVEQWIGISVDEMQRMKASYEPFIKHRWPLIEARMSRGDCLRWMAQRQYPVPPKSSCIGCPYHSNAEWRNVRADPTAWADAIEVDESLRDPKVERRTRGALFLHRSCVPLAQADLSDGIAEGQSSLFDGECEGMCGV